jgi:hypothetical protein
MSVHIGRLSLRLPAGYAARAEAIGQGVAHGVAQSVAQLRPDESRPLATLQLQPVRIAAGASDAQVIQAVLQQLTAALELRS